ncbi:MAG: CoA protein activase [Candidatus Heimdallarchaeota archaeon]|nr:CoA protein activase [Candidatus Heimdallarchaeota archaeon]MCG3255338.1 CoA protein activase [Candidatus Heimdallarchaeota archaeon]MCK4610411.1 CoA protein activase [Candidatus Heimdallarchaeota archaeon]
MPITWPYFGSMTYVSEILAREIGRKDIMCPKTPNKRTFEIGARHSPEFVCTPFKITLGTFIEMLDEGADEIVTGGCHSWCRFGYYWPVQKLILEDLGYDFKFIPLDYLKPSNFLKTLKDDVSVGCSLWQVLKAFRVAWIKGRFIDLIDELHYRYRAIELEKGISDKIALKSFRMVVDAENLREVRKLKKRIPELFENNVEVDKTANPLKIVICGELYVVFEQTLNLDIHRRLNDMGIIVKNSVTVSSYLDAGHKANPFITMHYEKARKAAKPYLENRCGGETLENIGDIILYKKKGWDGVVHLYPFSCMPEIITRSFIPQISRDHNIPVISFVLDEHTGETGFQTRIEAFVDLLERRKEKNLI